MYGWTPAQIADMTPAQISTYLDDTGATPGRKRFATLADYNAWCEQGGR